MKTPLTVTITITDAEGEKIQMLEQYKLGEVELVAMQEAIAAALVGLGKAGLEAKRTPGKG